MPYNNYYLGTFLEKLSVYDRLHIVPIKGVECQTWRCDVSEFRFKMVIYLSGISQGIWNLKTVLMC